MSEDRIRDLEKQIRYLTRSIDDIKRVYEDQIDDQNNKIRDAIGYCRWLMGTKVFKLLKRWRGRQPLDQVINILESENNIQKQRPLRPLSDEQIEILSHEYTKYDVIIISNQRLENITDEFEKNGHRVFHVNPDSIKDITAHLDTLVFKYCIRDAIIITDGTDNYPGVDYLCGHYGFWLINDSVLTLGKYEDLNSIVKKEVPMISIVVLTYNNLEINKICIKSILEKTAYPNYELILVDNGSNDGTAEWLDKYKALNMPNTRVVFSKENLGFAAGNNAGIREAKGAYIVLLNNDTCVSRGWLSGMVKHLEKESILGMVGSVTNSTGNEAKIKVDYYDLSGMDPFAYSYTSEHIGELWKEPRMLAFFCAMIKREVVDKCGVLSEEYGRGFFEDDDYCMATRKAGYRIAIAEDSFVHHFQSLSFDKLEDDKYKELFDENRIIFEKKWDTKWIPHRYRYGINRETNTNGIE